MENSEKKVPITLEQAVALRSQIKNDDLYFLLVPLSIITMVASVIAFFTINIWFGILGVVGVAILLSSINLSADDRKEDKKLLKILKTSFDNKDSYEETVKKLKLWED